MLKIIISALAIINFGFATSVQAQTNITSTKIDENCFIILKKNGLKDSLKLLRSSDVRTAVSIASYLYRDAGSYSGSIVDIRFDNNYRTDISVSVMRSSMIFIGAIEGEDSERFWSLFARSSDLKVIFNNDVIAQYKLTGSTAATAKLDTCRKSV